MSKNYNKINIRAVNIGSINSGSEDAKIFDRQPAYIKSRRYLIVGDADPGTTKEIKPSDLITVRNVEGYLEELESFSTTANKKYLIGQLSASVAGIELHHESNQPTSTLGLNLKYSTQDALKTGIEIGMNGIVNTLYPSSSFIVKGADPTETAKLELKVKTGSNPSKIISNTDLDLESTKLNMDTEVIFNKKVSFINSHQATGAYIDTDVRLGSSGTIRLLKDDGVINARKIVTLGAVEQSEFSKGIKAEDSTSIENLTTTGTSKINKITATDTNTDINSPLTVKEATTLKKVLNVFNDTLIVENGKVTINGNLEVTGTTTTSGSVTVGEDLILNVTEGE